MIEVENILNKLDRTRSNLSHLSPAMHIESNNVQDNDLIVEDVLHSPPHNTNHETDEDAESSEHDSNEIAEETTINIEYLRDRSFHEIETYLLNFISEWGMRDVSFKKIDKLLAELRVIFPGLPKSYKTILHTLRTVNVKEVGQGLMWYKSIKVNLDERLTDDYLQNNNQIVVDINIDGVQLYKSTDDQFWPILGCLNSDRFPFIIGVWYGHSKPNNLKEYLSDFIKEVKNLTTNGYNFYGTNINFKIGNYYQLLLITILVILKILNKLILLLKDQKRE